MSKEYAQKVLTILDELTDSDWDDVRELTVRDLAIRFQLPDAEARYLHDLIKEQTDPRYCIDAIPTQPGDMVLDTIKESIHQGFDGWSEHEQLIIRAYLADIALAVANS